MGLLQKTTITLWPPEHGKKPHMPIEVSPESVEEFKAKGWREKDPKPETKQDPPAEDETGSSSEPPEDPPGRKKKSHRSNR